MRARLVLLAALAVVCGCIPDDWHYPSSDAATPDVPVTPDASAGDVPTPPDDTPATCNPPRGMCRGVCVDFTTDPANCGTCGRACAAGQVCAASQCSLPAGAPCTMPAPLGGNDPVCGDMQCFPAASPGGGVCTRDCANDASQSVEQSTCGGVGTTCLTGAIPGEGQPSASSCTASCDARGTTPATGGCRAGMVCTGYWYVRGGVPDALGCAPFCTANEHCPTGTLCNARTGRCTADGVVATRPPDGSPCNPNSDEAQCRGICFGGIDRDSSHGICGSFINLILTASCPDGSSYAPHGPAGGGDNLAICYFKNCMHNRECASPLVCRYPEDGAGRVMTAAPRICNFPTVAQPAGTL